MTDPILFSWLHLSDIHFGRPNAAEVWDQLRVLGQLLADAKKLVSEREVPTPKAIFVTGDVAFHGAAAEYRDAKVWLLSFADAVKVATDWIFLVPGNHDVQRTSALKDRNIERLVKSIRNGDECFDECLLNVSDVALLGKRMEFYLGFAQDFAPAVRTGTQSPQRAWCWRHEIALEYGLSLVISGSNTSILADDDSDKGKLRLGGAQLYYTLAPGQRSSTSANLFLSHHPVEGNWLADQNLVSPWVHNHAHIHLCGHIHKADKMNVVSGDGTSNIHVTAGAAHGDTAQDTAPASHGYNFAALSRTADGKVWLDVWPRRWSATNVSFVLDIENVPDGKDHSSDCIVGFCSDASLDDLTCDPLKGVVEAGARVSPSLEPACTLPSPVRPITHASNIPPALVPPQATLADTDGAARNVNIWSGRRFSLVIKYRKLVIRLSYVLLSAVVIAGASFLIIPKYGHVAYRSRVGHDAGIPGSDGSEKRDASGPSDAKISECVVPDARTKPPIRTNDLRRAVLRSLITDGKGIHNSVPFNDDAARAWSKRVLVAIGNLGIPRDSTTYGGRKVSTAEETLIDLVKFESPDVWHQYRFHNRTWKQVTEEILGILSSVQPFVEAAERGVLSRRIGCCCVDGKILCKSCPDHAQLYDINDLEEGKQCPPQGPR